MKNVLILLMFFGAVVLGCEETEPDFAIPPGEESGDGNNNSNNDDDNNNGGGGGDDDVEATQEKDDENCQSILRAVVRDFKDSHPDFHHIGENFVTENMVKNTLDDDDKPVRGDVDFHSANIDEWYRTIDGTNIAFSKGIKLRESETDPGVWSYSKEEFFPLDEEDDSWGFDIPDHDDHNYLFTTEIVMDFVYQKGQVFEFQGDDDLWVFIDRRLALDIGGIHIEITKEVDIDAFAEKQGLEEGKRYSMHIFHAERNPTESHFKITTSIACFKDIVI